MPSLNTGNAILSNAITVDGSYRVGIGTSTLTAGIPLSINVTTGNNCNVAFQENASDKWYLRNITSSNAFSFYSVAGSTEVMRLTSSGNAGINCTPNAQFEVFGNNANLLTDGIRVSRNTLQSSQYGQINYVGGVLNLTGVVVGSGGGVRINSNDGTTNKEIARFDSAGNIDYGGYNVIVGNPNTTYKQAFYGGLSIMWRNASDWYLDSNHSYSTTNGNIATYNNTEGIGRLGCSGGSIDWSTYNGSVTAGSGYALTAVFTINKSGLIYMPAVYNNTGGGSGTVAISASGELYRATSSIKYKENVTDYNKGLAEVLQLRPVYYNVKREDDNNLYAGLIAEEIEELGLKEFVQYAEDGTPDAIYYANMISLMTKAIQELNQTIQNQQQQINQLINK